MTGAHPHLELFEFRALPRGEDAGDLLVRRLDLAPDTRLDGCPDLVHPRVPSLEDFFDLFPLIGGEVEMVVEALGHGSRRKWRNTTARPAVEERTIREDPDRDPRGERHRDDRNGDQ